MYAIVKKAGLHANKEGNLVQVVSATAWELLTEKSLQIAQQETTEDKALGPQTIVNAPIHVNRVTKFTPVLVVLGNLAAHNVIWVSIWLPAELPTTMAFQYLTIGHAKNASYLAAQMNLTITRKNVDVSQNVMMEKHLMTRATHANVRMEKLGTTRLIIAAPHVSMEILSTQIELDQTSAQTMDGTDYQQTASVSAISSLVREVTMAQWGSVPALDLVAIDFQMI